MIMSLISPLPPTSKQREEISLPYLIFNTSKQHSPSLSSPLLSFPPSLHSISKQIIENILVAF